MKKLLKRSLLSILSLFMILSFTTLTNKVHAKSDTMLDVVDNSNHEVKPAYISDVPFWDFSAHYSTWSYKSEGWRIKFKVRTPYGNKDGWKEKTIYIPNGSKAEELKSIIRSIYSTEYSVIASTGLSLGYLYSLFQTGGLTAVAAVEGIGWGSQALNEFSNLMNLHEEGWNIAKLF